MEKHQNAGKDLHPIFIDLEKAFDRVPRDLIWIALRAQKLPETYVTMIQDMYDGVTTKVKCSSGISEAFSVKVGVHQGSCESPLLFNTVQDFLLKQHAEEAGTTCLLFEGRPKLGALIRAELAYVDVRNCANTRNSYCTTIIAFCFDSSSFVHFCSLTKRGNPFALSYENVTLLNICMYFISTVNACPIGLFFQLRNAKQSGHTSGRNLVENCAKRTGRLEVEAARRLNGHSFPSCSS